MMIPNPSTGLPLSASDVKERESVGREREGESVGSFNKNRYNELALHFARFTLPYIDCYATSTSLEQKVLYLDCYINTFLTGYSSVQVVLTWHECAHKVASCIPHASAHVGIHTAESIGSKQ